MNAKEHFEKAILEGVSIGRMPVEKKLPHIETYYPEIVEETASTLSAGLIVLTEDELRKLLTKSFLLGCDPMWHAGADVSASRIMREVKGGE